MCFEWSPRVWESVQDRVKYYESWRHEETCCHSDSCRRSQKTSQEIKMKEIIATFQSSSWRRDWEYADCLLCRGVRPTFPTKGCRGYDTNLLPVVRLFFFVILESVEYFLNRITSKSTLIQSDSICQGPIKWICLIIICIR